MTFDPKKLDQFPSLPGVYLMKGNEGEILYVGKGKNLRQRVKQYFVPGRDGRLMVPFLIAKVQHIDTIVVTSEKEALILENILIKQHKPRYNALLKDDKTYISIKITTKDKWPTLKVVRYRGKPEGDGLYFGPYTSAFAARETLELLNRLFPLRQCSNEELARRTRPCILYEMKRCVAPCVNKCTKEEYDHYVQQTVKFLRGQDKEVLQELQNEMQSLADQLEFEKAALILRTIRQIEKTIEVQHVDRPLGLDLDALAIYRHAHEVAVVQLKFRHGRLIGSSFFDFHDIAEDDDELLTSFILQTYEKFNDVPPEILIPFPVINQMNIEEILSKLKGKKVRLQIPLKGERKSLLEMAKTNAEVQFNAQKNQDAIREKILLEMEERFSLTRYPARIECFDTSTLSGFESVASMVAFTDGSIDNKRYRTYRIKQGLSKPDDYQAMKEVLTRRYRRAQDENDLPDLVIVDGGKGHLNIAKQVFNELNVTNVDLIGLAKEEGRHDKGMTEEKVFLLEKKDPILLKKNSPVLFLLQRIRDEAHRTAITFHRKRRAKQTVRSALDDIPGIGPAKRKLLLKYFGSLKQVGLATEEDLKKVKGISHANILAIQSFFRSNTE